MKRRDFLLTNGLALAGLGLGLGKVTQTQAAEKNIPYEWPEQFVWLRPGELKTKDDWKKVCDNLKQHNIGGLFIEGGDHDVLEMAIPVARSFGIRVHSWFWSMNRNVDPEAEKHPDWYMVSRKGESSLEKKPYVDYYRWVCPSKEEVYEYLKGKVEALCKISELDGVHLDYIRYPDVILPEALQPVYKLVQDREFPEFDFCYCEDCRKKFLDESGIDIRKLEDPTKSEEWRFYRYDSITRVVNRLAGVIHSYKKLATAAVFPYPDLAKTICRQNWRDWNLDAVFPMIYQNFYNKDIKWIEFATRRGLIDLKGSKHLFTGLYIPELTAAELKKAKEVSLKAGAKGIAIFDYGSFTKEKWNAIK